MTTKISFFDTHIHFNETNFSKQFDQQINQYIDCWFSIIGTNLEDSKIALSQANKYPNTFCSIGIHPLEIDNCCIDSTMAEIKQLLNKNKGKIVAIGETGLDFYKTTKEDSYEQQVKWLNLHGEISKEFALPLIIHSRNSNKELIEIIKKNQEWFGIIHSFFGTEEELKEYLKMNNWMISISPLIFRHDIYKTLISLIPIERLLVETDAPWLGKDSSIIPKIIEEISIIKNIDIKILAKQLMQNGKKLFKLN